MYLPRGRPGFGYRHRCLGCGPRQLAPTGCRQRDFDGWRLRGPSEHEDPILVPVDSFVLNHVLDVVRIDKTNGEVAQRWYVFRLNGISISADPVRTEPVPAGARHDSYAVPEEIPVRQV